MTSMFSSLGLVVLASLTVMILALTLPASANSLSSPIDQNSSQSTSSTTPSNFLTIPSPQPQTQNLTTTPSNDIACSNKLPAIVETDACEVTYRLFSRDPRSRWKQTWQNLNSQPEIFGTSPCSILLVSTASDTDEVQLSVMDIMNLARDVWQTCHLYKTGGFNEFKRHWRVVVTREYPFALFLGG